MDESERFELDEGYIAGLDDTIKSEDAEDLDSNMLEDSNPIAPEDIDSLAEEIYSELDEFIKKNVKSLSNPKFHKSITEHILNFAYGSYVFVYGVPSQPDETLFGNLDVLLEFPKGFKSFVFTCIDSYFSDTALRPSMPESTPRQILDSRPTKTPNIASISAQLDIIRNTPQPAQRTPEWYAYRHNMMTASSIMKALGSDKVMASFISEKCGLCRGVDTPAYESVGNTCTPMHHGVKYEPVSVMLYERLTGARVGEFGCMRHPKHSCIGASPDGIAVNPESNRYGRMLEIKNIFNRVITGVPTEAYWAQMQFQMEVFGLDECDFFETRIVEFENEAMYWEDAASEYKGVVLYFLSSADTGYKITYKYMPLDIDTKTWISETTATMELAGFVLYETLYWRLDQWSCVLVPRHAPWLEWAVPQALETWKKVEAARASGALPVATARVRQHVCVIKLEECGE